MVLIRTGPAGLEYFMGGLMGTLRVGLSLYYT